MQGDQAIFPAIVLLLFIAVIHPIHWHNSGSALHVFIMGFSVRALTFRMNGQAASCLWSKALFVTELQ